MHPIPSLPEKHRDDIRQGAGRQFAWLEVGSGKMVLSRPAHQQGIPQEHAGQAAHR